MHRLKRLVVSAAVLAFVSLFPARVQTRSDPVPSFEEIIYNLKAANTGLNSFVADQVIDVQVWLLRFRVLTTVYAVRPARYQIVVREAPWFVRALGSVFEHVGAPEDLLVLYNPKAIEYTEDGGRRLLRVAVVKEDPAANPPAGEMVVDPARWLVEKMRLRYDWGDVFAEYAYGQVAGYWLPVRVPVRIPRYGIEAVATFRNYRLNVPIPDRIFSSTAR